MVTGSGSISPAVSVAIKDAAAAPVNTQVSRFKAKWQKRSSRTTWMKTWPGKTAVKTNMWFRGRPGREALLRRHQWTQVKVTEATEQLDSLSHRGPTLFLFSLGRWVDESVHSSRWARNASKPAFKWTGLPIVSRGLWWNGWNGGVASFEWGSFRTVLWGPPSGARNLQTLRSKKKKD